MTDTILELIPNLPDDIRSKILLYTYCPQSNELCEDIRSFYNISHKLHCHYNNNFPSSPSEQPEDSAIAWLSNDIGRFLNNDVPIMYGYEHFYLELYQRLYKNKNKSISTMNEYITRLDDTLFPRDIKIVVGLLHPGERNELIKFIDSITPGIINTSTECNLRCSRFCS